MKKVALHIVDEYWPSLVFVLICSLAILGYGGYEYDLIRLELKNVNNERQVLLSKLNVASGEISKLNQELVAKQAETDALGEEVRGIASTVGTLDKLSKTDKELLAKYSKVYFLNENYVPRELSLIDSRYWGVADKPLEIHAGVKNHLEDLLDDAQDDDMGLEVISAYRSFGTQAALKTSYKVTYGLGANTFSADQGYSEHQLGTAIDFTTERLGVNFSNFESSPAYPWLLKNAYKYGFILSYPKGNAYYQFEPWHWRYVGIDLATKLHDEGKHFYDLDQREIDTYLANIFD